MGTIESSATDQQTITIRPATVDDLDALVSMINAAYLVSEGHVFHRSTRIGRRTNHDDLSRRVDGLRIAVIDSRIAACVHIETLGEYAHFGLLATSVTDQGRGLASMLIAHAEAAAIEAGHAVMRIEVVREGGNIPFYERRGYRVTGETDGQVWNGGADWAAVIEWHMTDMEKQLR